MDMKVIDKIVDTELYSIPDIAEMLDIHPITAREKVIKLVPDDKEYKINFNTGGSIKVWRVTGYAIKHFILGLKK